ncbi:MAG: protein translocase subunit SecF [Bacteriovoracia bacterium]
MFNIVKPGTNFDFVGKRHIWVGISAVGMIAAFAMLFTKGLNYGIDFTGGAEVQVKTNADWDIGKVRGLLEKSGIVDPKVQQVGDPSAHEFIVKAKGAETGDAAAEEKALDAVSKQLTGLFTQTFGDGSVLRVDVVGPQAGGLLRKKGFLAMFYALLAILVYVAIRFDTRYAPGAVIALFHDSVITLLVFILTGKQFDLTILAAILALIGYSNNDTIIVFDRVRETTHQHPNMTIEQVVNRAINETLGRTIVTSLTTFLTVSALWWFGGSVLENFAFCLMVGIVVGAYSSVFIASALVITLTKYQQKRDQKMKMSGGKRKRYEVRGEPKFQN